MVLDFYRDFVYSLKSAAGAVLFFTVFLFLNLNLWKDFMQRNLFLCFPC